MPPRAQLVTHDSTGLTPHRVVIVSPSHAEGRKFAPQPGHTKEHHKNATICPPAWHAYVRVGV